jgi:hypothetical protein
MIFGRESASLLKYRSSAAALGAQPARVELQRRFRQREADFLVAVKDLISELIQSLRAASQLCRLRVARVPSRASGRHRTDRGSVHNRRGTPAREPAWSLSARPAQFFQSTGSWKPDRWATAAWIRPLPTTSICSMICTQLFVRRGWQAQLSCSLVRSFLHRSGFRLRSCS